MLQRQLHLFPDTGRGENALGRNRHRPAILHRPVERLEQLGQTGVASLALEEAAAERRGRAPHQLPRLAIRREYLVDARCAGADLALHRTPHVVGEDRSVGSRQADVALDRPALQRYDKRAGELAGADQGMHRPALADVEGHELRAPAPRRL